MGPAAEAVSKKHRQALYTALLLSGKLSDHLSETDSQAKDMFFQFVEQMAEREGITEQLKEDSQMEWVGKMNNLGIMMAEIVLNDLIYT